MSIYYILEYPLAFHWKVEILNLSNNKMILNEENEVEKEREKVEL